MTKATGKELTTTTKARGGIMAAIQRQAPQFRLALGKSMDPERFTRVAMTTVRTSDALMRCNPQSVLASLMLCAQLNLEPGPLGHAYLVPFGSECTFIVGYQGLIELAYRSGQVLSIYAELVHEHDAFEQHLGTERRIEHKPPPFGQARGKVVGVYAVAKLRGGATQFVVMTADEVERIRQMSRGKNSMMWEDHWEAAAKKTVIRQLAKWIPKSTEMQAAIAADDAAERGASQPDASGLDFGGMGDLDEDADSGEVYTAEVVEDAQEAA